jgi:hypothetical protein
MYSIGRTIHLHACKKTVYIGINGETLHGHVHVSSFNPLGIKFAQHGFT